MGFRFFNFSPIYRSYISHKNNSIIALTNHVVTIQSVPAQSQETNCPSPPNCQIFKRWHFGHPHHDHHHHHHGPHQGSSSKESENIFRLGLAADIGLTAGKGLTGYLSGSTAIIADAAHSLSDVITLRERASASILQQKAQDYIQTFIVAFVLALANRKDVICTT